MLASAQALFRIAGHSSSRGTGIRRDKDHAWFSARPVEFSVLREVRLGANQSGQIPHHWILCGRRTVVVFRRATEQGIGFQSPYPSTCWKFWAACRHRDCCTATSAVCVAASCASLAGLSGPPSISPRGSRSHPSAADDLALGTTCTNGTRACKAGSRDHPV